MRQSEKVAGTEWGMRGLKKVTLEVEKQMLPQRLEVHPKRSWKQSRSLNEASPGVDGLE